MVDSFKFLPRILRALYESEEIGSRGPIPWTPLSRPIQECSFGLVSSAGFFYKTSEPPFDLERERAEPTWGDPSYRAIPAEAGLDQVGVSHLHLNTRDLEKDFNILLPIHRFQELVAAGRINALAGAAFSFMGYQGFPPNTRAWEEIYTPEVIEYHKAEGVDCVFLTTA